MDTRRGRTCGGSRDTSSILKMDMADNDGAKGSEYIVSCGVRGCHQLFAFSGRELSDGGSCFDKGGDGFRT